MDVKQEYYEICEQNIKTEAVLIYGQTEESNSLSIKSEKFKNDDENELDDKVDIFESKVTGQLISIDEFKQEIKEVSKTEHSDLVTEQVQIFPTSTIKQELENTTKVETADIGDISEYVQFKNESELLTSLCDLQTLKSDDNDYPDNLIQSCSSTEDVPKNCSNQHPCIVDQKNYPSSSSGLNQIDGGHFKDHLASTQQSNHVKIHANEKSFECDICSQEFNKKSHYKTFNLTNHYIKCDFCSNEKPFKCDICFTEFKHKGSLKRHLIIHTNEKPFKCDICSKEFNDKSNFKQHLIIHSNKKSLKPFKCDFCYKQFNKQINLKRHLQIHSNEKPFKCDICSKEFKQKYNLHKHLTIHHNEKPFKCDICFITFNRKLDLQKHLKIHSNKKLFRCDICCQEFKLKIQLESHLEVHSMLMKNPLRSHLYY